MIWSIISFLLILSNSLAISEDLIVELPEGKIRGHILKSFNGNNYNAFQEVPYAAPPIGENRFKEPKNPIPWHGVLETIKNSKSCIQNEIHAYLNKTEDCLYLNVYTPQNTNNALLPVMVFIHGGGFTSGSGGFFQKGPHFFMDYGIVIVTINYRLGPLGFLTTGDGVIPANLGLKDQRQALRWVNKNIQLFGGDPNKVTIAGESAGSWSVSYHLLSQNSDGLFRAAIQESGTAMSMCSFTDIPKSNAFQLGNLIDTNLNEQNSSSDLLKVLLKADALDILAAGEKVHGEVEQYPFGYLGNSIWAAVIENSKDSEDPFLTTLMYDSFLNGNFHQVPSLIGYNSEEALAFASGRDCFFGNIYDSNPSTMVGRKLNIPTEDRTIVGKQLKNIYTNTLFANDTAACIKYSSDVNFLNPSVRQAECTSKFVPTYLYQFSYLGELAEKLIFPNGRPLIPPGAEKVAHGEDLAYFWVYEYGMNISTISDSDKLTVQRLQTLWTNFVKYLNPTPEPDPILQNVKWPKVINEYVLIQYLNIDSNLQVRANPRYYKQVKAVLEKYQQPPFVTW